MSWGSRTISASNCVVLAQPDPDQGRTLVGAEQIATRMRIAGKSATWPLLRKLAYAHRIEIAGGPIADVTAILSR